MCLSIGARNSCPVQMASTISNIYILTLCKEPTGEIKQFLNHLDILPLKTKSFQQDSNYFQNSINDVSTGLNKWLKVSKLTLHFHKNKLNEIYRTCINMRTSEDVLPTMFLGIQINNDLKGK
jgi:hypothetical protein